jgi:hypothetical protein
MPSVAENALERLQGTVTSNIERVVVEAIQKAFAENCKK